MKAPIDRKVRVTVIVQELDEQGRAWGDGLEVDVALDGILAQVMHAPIAMQQFAAPMFTSLAGTLSEIVKGGG